jgi:alpha-L-fucosidase
MAKRKSSKKAKEDFPMTQGPFKPTWESLRKFQCPDWFRNAKLGIWAHWGPQCVPMYGDWYARNIYIEGSDQYRYHWRTYGHPSEFGYKDIVKLWKAEKFDPDGLMDLYKKAGAKYFVAQAVHHDNFDNWNSRHHKWNAVNIGPEKDIVGLWGKAARKRGLRFGVTEHAGATYNWFAVNKDCDKEGPYAGVPYDGNDPAYRDFYLPSKDKDLHEWYTDNAWWHRKWYARMKDLVDQHQPDLLYSDGGVPFCKADRGVFCDQPGLSLIAHLYNTSAALHGGANEAVYNQKDKDEKIFTVGVLDLERHMTSDIFPYPWQTDTCVGGWFHNVRLVYKTPKQVVQMLVDIVSKNGNLLLNFTQRPDGTLDDECLHILDCMAKWIKVNGEGIYDTRPWKVAGEGPTGEEGEYAGEGAVDYKSQDFRFTAKGKTVYAFQMNWPEDGKAFIRSLGSNNVPKVTGVKLLGAKGKVAFEQAYGGLVIRLPGKPVCDYAHCFRVEMG